VSGPMPCRTDWHGSAALIGKNLGLSLGDGDLILDTGQDGGL
jgi:hypothetical protein